MDDVNIRNLWKTIVMLDKKSGSKVKVEFNEAEESTDRASNTKDDFAEFFSLPSRATGLFFEKFLRLDNTERCVLHRTFDR